MKKSKLLILGVITLMLAFGMALASCGDDQLYARCEFSCGRYANSGKEANSCAKGCLGSGSNEKAWACSSICPPKNFPSGAP
jgi:hypothetical protein